MASFWYPERSEQAKEDREALEHIARALAHSRAAPSEAPPGEISPDDVSPEAQDLTPPALNLDDRNVGKLLDVLPAALALLSGDELAHANAAFANAFGYRSFAELSGAGGLAAIVPAGLENAETVMRQGSEGRLSVRTDALTRGRRQIKANFEIVPFRAGTTAPDALVSEAPLRLLRLIDQTMLAAAAAPEIQPSQGIAALREAAPLLSNGRMATEAMSPSEPPRRSVAADHQLSFLAKISHEVRTPLNSILGFTELMIGEKLGRIGNERYKGYIEDIHQSGLYALSLLNDLLDLSKIEAGKFDLDFASVEIAEIVEECVHILQPLAKRERILLRVSLEPNLPNVIADRRRLKQILLNLLSNAIKFTREGGQVILSGKLAQGEALRLRVHDNGVGMSANEIRLAMQPFQQLDTTPRAQTGTGLGLPLTKALIEASRARFMLTSEAGVGTSADVVFPKERLDAAERA